MKIWGRNCYKTTAFSLTIVLSIKLFVFFMQLLILKSHNDWCRYVLYVTPTVVKAPFTLEQPHIVQGGFYWGFRISRWTDQHFFNWHAKGPLVAIVAWWPSQPVSTNKCITIYLQNDHVAFTVFICQMTCKCKKEKQNCYHCNFAKYSTFWKIRKSV